MGKIRRGNLPPNKGSIPLVADEDVKVRFLFSFRHLDLHTNKKFCVSRCKDGYLDTLLKRLRDLSHNTV